jgi:AmmeMemoRadiSam system protein A
MLSKENKDKLLKIARSTIETLLKEGKIPDFGPMPSELNQPRGVFVTIHKKGLLRGCIGYVEPIKPLWEAVREMAISAAVKDPRFTPLIEDELPEIDIEISVLSPLRKINTIEEIQLGRDGLYIEKGPFSGLLLPQVATEYGWNKIEFLEHTALKAGLDKSAWKNANIYIFSAEIFSEKD